MHAAVITDGKVRCEERPDPQPGLGQLLVRVRAAGLNGADLHQVRGGYPAPPGVPADIPGLELAGEVAQAGPGVTRFKPGDPVMAVVGGGGQAGLAIVHEREAMPVPAVPVGDWRPWGGLPEVFTTAHDALFTQAGLRMGERLCVHGAAGGVGTAAVQLAVAAGAQVVGTVRSPEVRERVADLGAEVIDPSELGGHGPFDVILELVGAPNMAADLDALSTGGRVSVIGIGGGARADVDLGVLMGKRARIYGSTLRNRPLEGKAAAARRVEAEVLPLFASGRLHVPVHAAFPLADVDKAYESFAAGGKFGKIILEA